MSYQHVHSKETASTVTTSGSSNIFSNSLYAYYYFHMIILSVLSSSPNMMVAMSGMIWLKRAMLIANFITFIYCIYRLIKNKQMTNWCMNHMPTWMDRWLDHMPTWVYRWSHNSMRIMMIGMDLMLAWMCVEFGLSTLNKFGW
jgi:uncharacterized membrane protein